MARRRAASTWLVVSLLALGAAACSAPPAESPSEGRTLDLNTEVASFYLFHPDDLPHRRDSDALWILYEFAIAPEFAAGNLVAFDTGADGLYRIRLTRGDLSAREQKFRSCSWDFRYRVRHARVLIDGGDFLPRDNRLDIPGEPLPRPDAPEPIPPDQWFALPNGDYKVTVHAIDWEREPGAANAEREPKKRALPAYVIQFKPVARLDSIRAIACAPRLESGPGAEAKFYPVSPDPPNEESSDEPVPESCPVIVAPTLTLVPGFTSEPITVALSEIAAPAPERASAPLPDPVFGTEPPPDFERAVVLVDSEQVPRLGALCMVKL